MTHKDMLDRSISVGDYVVSYNNIYQITDLLNNSYVRIMLINPSKTTRPKKEYCKYMCLINTEDMLVWKLKQGY